MPASPHQTAAIALADLPARQLCAVVGFDGFIDHLCRIVEQRNSPSDWSPVPTMTRFADHIARAAGSSLGRELVITESVPGGNGPNFASALARLGVNTHYAGTLGQPIDPIFGEFVSRCASCDSVADALGRTYAFEFDDGKIMLNDTASLASLTPQAMHDAIDNTRMAQHCNKASLIAIVNWTKYPFLPECVEVLRDRVLNSLDHEPWLLADFADPAGIPRERIEFFLATLRSLQPRTRVILSLNQHEADIIATVLDLDPTTDAPTRARAIAAKTGINNIIVRTRPTVALATPDGDFAATPLHNENPKRTTGVGDRFNAAFSATLLAGSPPDACLAAACTAANHFVTTATEVDWETLRTAFASPGAS